MSGLYHSPLRQDDYVLHVPTGQVASVSAVDGDLVRLALPRCDEGVGRCTYHAARRCDVVPVQFIGLGA